MGSNTFNMEDANSKLLYWFNDINILFRRDKLDKFIPTGDMNYVEKNNALVRLGIYTGLLFSIFSKNYLYMYIPIGLMCFTYIMFLLKKVNYESHKNMENLLNSVGNVTTDVDNGTTDFGNTEKEQFDNTKATLLCVSTKNDYVKPTVDNPFMNPSPVAPRDINPPSSPLNEGTQKIIESKFNKNIFKDANDIFNHRNGNRQFYTVPGNTFPNDRDTFMKWCYNRPKTCKEGNGEQCYENIYSDPRENCCDKRGSNSKV
jgi:hypothetical protein